MSFTLIIIAAAKKVGISGSMLLAVCMHETGLKNITVQEDGGSPSYGVCQVKYDTAEMLGYKGKPEGLKNVKENAKWAAIYLKKQYERYDGDWCKAVAAYNAGRYNESKIKPGFPRNLKYVNLVKRKLNKDLQPHLSCDRTIENTEEPEEYMVVDVKNHGVGR